MLKTLQLFIAPLAALGFTAWAAWLALAAESDAAPSRPAPGEEKLPLSLARSLHVAHLALLVLAGVCAAGAVAWWAWSFLPSLVRLGVAVSSVWIVADLLPRLLGAIAPELTAAARRTAAGTLIPFVPLLRMVAWADARTRPPETTADRRLIGPAQRDMLLGVFSLADTTVAEVMTPRIDIVAVDSSAEREDVIATLRSSEHARLLVYDGHPDAVVGVVYAKDMLGQLGQEEDSAWQALIRPAAFVPEGKTLDRQLRDFQAGPSHLAVVVDEFGGTAGIVTLEDILEQVVGEIQDEYDTDEVAPIQPIGEDRYRVQGGVALSELEAILDHSFGREDVSTVGGWILAELGRVPRAGESIDLGGFEVTVEQVVRRRVKRVSVRRMHAPAQADLREEDES